MAEEKAKPNVHERPATSPTSCPTMMSHHDAFSWVLETTQVTPILGIVFVLCLECSPVVTVLAPPHLFFLTWKIPFQRGLPITPE